MSSLRINESVLIVFKAPLFLCVVNVDNNLVRKWHKLQIHHNTGGWFQLLLFLIGDQENRGDYVIRKADVQI